MTEFDNNFPLLKKANSNYELQSYSMFAFEQIIECCLDKSIVERDYITREECDKELNEKDLYRLLVKKQEEVNELLMERFAYKQKVRDAIEPYMMAGAYPGIFKEIWDKLGLDK